MNNETKKLKKSFDNENNDFLLSFPPLPHQNKHEVCKWLIL